MGFNIAINHFCETREMEMLIQLQDITIAI
jgi:hypothetical protein